MRTIATFTFTCLLTATAAVAQTPQQPPALDKSAAVKPPAADQTLGMALLGAYVLSNGTLNSGAGATGASRLSAGNYEVDFNRDVSGCFYSAAPFGTAILAALEPRENVPNGVFVFFQATDGSQTATDDNFYLTVFCAN